MIELMPNNILVRMAETTNDSMFIIPDLYKEKSCTAEIIALGACILKKVDDKYIEIPFSVSVGETVLMTKYAGFEIIIDDEHLWLITENDILGAFECE